jgi:glycerol 3-phosphatase-2
VLKRADAPLWSEYDLAVLDLDGVVYIGAEAVPGASEHLARAASAGMHLAYVTNNASRPPRAIADHLTELGIPASATDVVTSAQAAARVLRERLEPGSPVFVIGGPGLFEALDELDLRPVQSLDDDPVAVVSGYSRDLRWGIVSEGAMLVRSGLPWVASNTDYSVPTPHGHGPGNGVLVDAVSRFAQREPVVAGKPQPPLFQETQRRVGGRRPLVVGDRLDTDIEGAVNTGLDSLLVLTGVTGLVELVNAPSHRRPTYLSTDLAGLGRPHPAPVAEGEEIVLGGWRAAADSAVVKVEGEGDPADWWRVVAAVGWAHLDRTGQSVDTAGLVPPR